MQRSHRYQLQQLNLLQKTCNQTLYCKRKHGNFGLSLSVKISKNILQIQHPKSNVLRSADKEYKGTKSELTTKIIKDKLNDYFLKNTSKSNYLFMKKNGVQRNENHRKNQQFRINTYRHPFNRHNHPKAQQISNETALQEICQQFRVKEASIERRESVNDPRQYGRLGLRRNFLKFHGQHKCFEKAVQFKDNRIEQKCDQVTNYGQKSKVELGKDCSLEYSSDQPQWGEVEGWRKPVQILEWSVFSNLESSVN